MKQTGGTVRITGGAYSGRTIQTPGGATHPMGERERLALFNMILDYVRKSRVLDLYCGGGTLGIEALSRGAEGATFLDNSKKAIEIVKKNCESFGVDSGKWETIISDAKSLNGSKQYDLVFADPPYDNYKPEMVNNLSKLVVENGILVLSHPGEVLNLPEMRLLKTREYANAHISIYIKG